MQTSKKKRREKKKYKDPKQTQSVQTIPNVWRRNVFRDQRRVRRIKGWSKAEARLRRALCERGPPPRPAQCRLTIGPSLTEDFRAANEWRVAFRIESYKRRNINQSTTRQRVTKGA